MKKPTRSANKYYVVTHGESRQSGGEIPVIETRMMDETLFLPVHVQHVSFDAPQVVVLASTTAGRPCNRISKASRVENIARR